MSTATTPALRGDEDTLYREHHAAVLGMVRRRITASDALTEDACAHAWLQLLRYQPDRHAIRGWLITVATNQARRQLGHEHREPTANRDPDQLADPRDPALTIGAHEALRTLAELPQRQRTYLALLIAGHSYNEIAAHCQTSHTAVNKHLTRARSTIRQSRH